MVDSRDESANNAIVEGQKLLFFQDPPSPLVQKIYFVGQQ